MQYVGAHSGTAVCPRGHGRCVIFAHRCGVCLCVSVDPAATGSSHTLNTISVPSTEQALETRALSHLNFAAALPPRYCIALVLMKQQRLREVQDTNSAKMRLTAESGVPERSLRPFSSRHHCCLLSSGGQPRGPRPSAPPQHTLPVWGDRRGLAPLPPTHRCLHHHPGILAREPSC